MSGRFVPRDVALTRFIKPRRNEVLGPNFKGGLSREFLKRFSPDSGGWSAAPCEQELTAVLDAMGEDPLGSGELKGAYGQGLVDALRRCMALREPKGAKPTTNYHLFRAARPRK
jgi:hypothetical protein